MNATALPLTDTQPQLALAPLRAMDSITGRIPEDAGVGKGAAGIADLHMLKPKGPGAWTLSHTTPRIGQASSTRQRGVIGHANATALAMGTIPGTPLKSLFTPPSRNPKCTHHQPHPVTIPADS